MKDKLENLLNMTMGGGNPRVEPSMYLHSLTLYALALNIRAKNILELGVRFGNGSTIPLLNAVETINGKLVSVDKIPMSIQTNSSHHEFILGDSLETLSTFIDQQRKFDIIFVDDWHDGKHVTKELLLCEQVITGPSSLILLHDLMWEESQPKYNNTNNTPHAEFANGGPYKGLMDFLKQSKNNWEYVTIPASNGLTILRMVDYIEK